MKGIANKISRANRPWVSILLFWLILTPVFSQAKELGEQQVRTAVQTWVRHVTADARPDAVIERMEPHKVNGETVAYIAHLSGGGFCLCGADDLVLPVYLYSPKGTYDRDNPNYQYILWEIETRLKNLQKGIEEKDPKLQPYEEALADRVIFWQDLTTGRIPRRMEGKGSLAEPGKMELNLTCNWDQESPYNEQCPPGKQPDYENCPLGCAVTAMAQIMYYWKHPNSGEGDGSRDYEYRHSDNWISEPLANDPKIVYWDDSHCIHCDLQGKLEWVHSHLRMKGPWDQGLYEFAQTVTDDPEYQDALSELWNRLPEHNNPTYDADFGATVYDWNLMFDRHTGETNNAEVAELCLHAGIALEVTWGFVGSETPRGRIDEALETHFRYDEDGRSSETIDIEEITEEIQWFRPVSMSGSRIAKKKGKVGHAWIIYGYNKGTDPDREFLVNMGWGGYFDDWYTLDNVYGPNGVYNLNRCQVTRIAPRDMVRFVGASGAGDGSPDNPYKDIGQALAEAPEGATLIFKAGSDNTFSEDRLVINRRLTLKGKDVTIRKGAKGVVIHPH